jgi:predicted unusual protein kinase regulating ubiquinone biosynthesis (AarF/ABC1/UbiB family)
VSESERRGVTSTSGSGRQPSGLGVRLRALWRAVVVAWQFVPFVWAWARDRKRFVFFGRSRDVTSEQRVQRARRLKTTFIDLGPAFIKLGQMLSTRPDALPGEYIDVLSELQDRVPPAPWSEIEPLLSAELGGAVEEHFDSFDTDPISGASLGQVYTAEIDGERVAVKVLRPGIRERVESDLRVLETLTPVLARGADPAQAYTLENLSEEFAATIREEMDYAHEARMLREIGASFADRDDVAIPEVVGSHSTDRVVTMTYLDGVKIDDVAAIDDLGVDRAELVQRLEEVYIQMIVEDGRFHADPHPGNLAVQADGTLVFYDFGMTGRLGPRTREQLMEFYIGLATDDVERVMDAFVAMGALDPAANRDVMAEAFEIVIEQFRGEDISEYRVKQLVGQFETQLYEFPMRLPRDLALVVRVTTVLEGVCRTLDPEFDFIEIITDYVMEQGQADAGEAIREEIEETVTRSTRSLVTAAPKAEAALDVADRGDLVLDTLLKDGNGLARTMAQRLLVGFVAAAGIPVAAFFYATASLSSTAIALGVTGVSMMVLAWSFRRSRGRTLGTPQFTRHEMRRRDGGE